MIEEIYARCPEMFAVASARAEEDWFAAKTHTHERHKFTRFPSIEVLAKFRDYQIGGIGLEPQDYFLRGENFALFEEIKVPSFSQDQLKSFLNRNLNLSEAVIKSLMVATGVKNYSKEFVDIYLENMVDTPENGGVVSAVKIGEREILTSAFAIRTAHRSAIARELYARENAAPHTPSWNWAAVSVNRSPI